MLTDDPSADYVVQGRGIHAILLDTWSADVVEKKAYVGYKDNRRKLQPVNHTLCITYLPFVKIAI